MKPEIRWSHAIYVFALLPLIFELTFIGLMFTILSEIDHSKQLREREVNEAFESSKFVAALSDSGSAALLAKLGMQGATKKSYHAETRTIDRAERHLMRYLMNDPEQTRFCLEFDKLYKAFGQSMREANGEFSSGNVIGSMKMRFRTIIVLQKIQNLAQGFQESQLQKAILREQKERDWKALMQTAIVVFFLFSVAIAAGLAFFLNKKIVRKLTALSDNAAKLSTLEPLAPALQGNDEFTRLDQAFRDMSQAVNSALRQEQQVVENATDMICSLNADGVFTRVNPASKRLLGLDAEKLIGNEFFQFVPSQHRQSCKHSFMQAKASPEPVSFEVAMLDNTGKAVETLWTANWSEAEKSLFCVVHDISERKQAERLRLDLTAMLSHDLRTPLTSIQVGLDMMAAGVFGKMPGETSAKVASAANQSLQAMYLINDLLDIEKLETSEIPLFLIPADISDLIEAALRDLLTAAKEKNITVEIQADSLKVLVDKEQFTRVLRNLLRNSIQHAPIDSTIEVSTQESGDICLISIKDQGPLVSEQEKLSIFDRFHDSAEGLPKRLEGSGLSLSVCRALVDAHKGQLIAETSVDGRFVFVLNIQRNIHI